MAKDKQKLQDNFNLDDNTENSDKSNSSIFSYVALGGLVLLLVFYIATREKEVVKGCMDFTATNYNPDANKDDGSCIYTKEAIKTITFRTVNTSIPGIEIVIKDNSNKTLDILTTNSSGEAKFILRDRNSLKIKYLHEDYNIVADRNVNLAYANIIQDDIINLHVYLKDSFSFFVKPIDGNNSEFLKDAKITSNKINFSSRLKDDMYEVVVTGDNLRQNNVKLNDPLDFFLSCDDYSSEKFQVIVDKMNINQTYPVKLIKGLSQQFVFIDSRSNLPIEDIKVKVNGRVLDETDSNGTVVYKYDGDGIGGTINLEVNVPKYLKFNQSYTLTSNTPPTNFMLDPIYVNLNIIDFPSLNKVNDLKIYHNDKDVSTMMPGGLYQIDLNSMNKNYDLIVKDPSGVYENSTLSVSIDKNNLGRTLNKEVYKKTNITFNIQDSNNNNLDGVLVKINGMDIEKSTNNNGSVTLDLPYTKNEIEVSYSKNGYLDQNEKFEIIPGNNDFNRILNPIIYYVNTIDFNTNLNVTNLNFVNKDILNQEYDNVNNRYVLHFSKLGSHNISIIDPENRFQNTTLVLDLNKNSILKSKKVSMYEITYLDISLSDKNIPLSNFEIYVNDKKIGNSNDRGTLNKLFEYTKPSVNIQIKGDYYHVLDTSLTIIPGNNTLNFEMKKLPPIIINVSNSETREKLNDIFVYVNDIETNTDGIGVISLNSKYVGEQFNIKYSDGDNIYYSSEINFKYDPKKINYMLNLKPVAYLYVSTYYSGSSKTPFKDAPIKIDNKIVATTDKNGQAKVKIRDYKKYKINILKERFEPVNLDIDINQSRTDIEVVLKKLTATLKLKNIFGSPVTDAQVSYKAGERMKNANVDKLGYASINPNYLNEPTEVRISSKTDIYRDTLIIFNFKENEENKNVKLLTNPLLLTLLVEDKNGIPAEGTVSFNPPPSDKSSFNLEDGTAVIKVYESGTYDISVSAVIAGAAIYHTEKIDIALENKNSTWEMPISNAIITAKTNDDVDVTVSFLDSGQEWIIKGDGIEELEVENFGKYLFTFTPPGFTYPKEEIRIINQFTNNLDFIVDDNFAKCIESYNSGRFSEAVNYCKLVSRGNKDYCEAQLKMAVIYSDELNEYIESANTWENILNNSRQGICEENYTYYQTHAYVLSKVNDIGEEETVLNNIWRPHNGSMDTSFDKYVSLCPIMGENCSEGERKLRLRILRSLCSLMEETESLYNATVDDVITGPLRDLNELFYDRSVKYAELVPYQEKSNYMECIENNKLD